MTEQTNPQMSELEKLVDTLEKQDAVKKDYVAAAQNLSFVDGRLVMTKGTTLINFTPTGNFHGQMASKLEIPKGYYDRMKDKAIHLLDTNVNHWLVSEKGKGLLVRAFEPEGEDNVARALLSDRYNMIDNMEVLMQTLETLEEIGRKVEVHAAELSETRMFLKITCPEIEVKATEMLKHYRKTVGVGTGIISGFVVKNSEIGFGAFEISPRAVVLCCDNGMVRPGDSMRKIHLGGQLDQLEFFKNDKIVNANRKLVKEQISHAAKKFLSEDYLKNLVNSLTELGSKEIQAPIDGVMEVVAKQYQISQERKANILKHFVRGGDTRRIGVVNAITEEVQELLDVDQKNDGEAICFDLLKNFDQVEAAAIKMIRSTN